MKIKATTGGLSYFCFHPLTGAQVVGDNFPNEPFGVAVVMSAPD